MDRRRFLQMCGGGLVATATMAEVGFFAEFMAWVKRMPVWSFPSKPKVVNCTITSYADFISISDYQALATIYYDRKALDALEANMPFFPIERPVALPEQRDKSIQMIRFVQNAFEDI